MTLLRGSRILPIEILLLIKHSIHPSDLRTHVCYYLSSPKIALLYDSGKEGDAFWELACWQCGIGMLPSDEESDKSWKDIAIDCIKRDGFCTSPLCGENLLRLNRQNMTCAEQDLDLAPLEVFLDADPEVTLTVHPGLEKIAFSSARGPTSVLKDVSSWSIEAADHGMLGRHPLLYHSFATSAPTAKLTLRLVVQEDQFAISRENAITVFDVVSSVHELLDEPLTVKEVANYLHFHEECLPANVKRSLFAPFHHLQTLRDLLRICPIRTFTHCGDDEDHGPIFEVSLGCSR